MRDCKTCVHSSPFHANDNGCTAWTCEYINKDEAIEAWRAKNVETGDNKKVPEGKY